MSSKKSTNKPANERSASQSGKKKVELDLPEILEGELRKEAEDECRTLEQHILYILKNRFRVLHETRITFSNEKSPSYMDPCYTKLYCGDLSSSSFNMDFPHNSAGRSAGTSKTTCC